MSATINWGILSTGAIARTMAQAIAQSTTGRLLAVASRQPESAAVFASNFNIERAYSTYEALLADPDVQVVYVATPHTGHVEWTIKAAHAGKHTVCEKPFAVNYAEAMAMFDAARICRRFCMEAFMYRCHPQTARLIELIRSQVIGDIQIIQAAFSFKTEFNPNSRLFSNTLAGGGILDMGCYTVSMARLIAGIAAGLPFADPVEVKGAAHLGPTGVDEWAVATLKFPNGILAQLTTGIGLRMDNQVRIHGTDGVISIPNPWCANRKDSQDGRILIHQRGVASSEEITVPATTTSFVYEVDTVGRAIRDGCWEAATPAMTWQDTLGNIKALDAWRDSIGLTYDFEKPGETATVTRRPLIARPLPQLSHETIAGVDQPVSRLVMGCDNQRQYTLASVMFDDFFERGGNCFDTAWIYGNGLFERHLGAWIESRNVRNRVVIIGKGAHSPYCYPQIIGVQLHETLNRLSTDYVDIYLMHRDNPDVPVGEFVEALNEQLRAGRCRAIGGSNWSLARVTQANEYARQHGLTGFVAISNNFSLARMIEPIWSGCISASDTESRAWLARHRIPLLAWSSQARGFFTARSAPDKRTEPELVRCWYSDDNFQRKERVMELAKQKGVTPTTMALAYVLAQPFPVLALIGPRELDETRASFDALNLSLTPDECRWLNLEGV